MAAPPSSSVCCEKGGQERDQTFMEQLAARCLLPFLTIDDPVDVADVLYAKQCINRNNYECVREVEKRSGKREAGRKLYDILTNRPNWFEQLIEVLEDKREGYPYVAEELRKIKEELEKAYQEERASSASNELEKVYQEERASSASNDGISNNTQGYDCVDGPAFVSSATSGPTAADPPSSETGEVMVIFDNERQQQASADPYDDCTFADSFISCTSGDNYDSMAPMEGDHEYQRLLKRSAPRPSGSSSKSAQSQPDGALGSLQERVQPRPLRGRNEKRRSHSFVETSPRRPELQRRHTVFPRKPQKESVLKGICMADLSLQQPRPLPDSPRSQPVPGTSGNFPQRTQEFFPSNDTYSDVSDLPGWAAWEHVTEAMEWLMRRSKGSYFFYAEGGGRLTLAVMSQDGVVEQFELESSRSCGLGKFQLQGQDQVKSSRRQLLEWHLLSGVRTSSRSLVELKKPWKPPKA